MTDVPHTRREVPATRRESLPPPTRREGGAGSGDGVPRVRRVRLPEELEARFRHEYDLPSPGAQADIAVCTELATDRLVAIKIYRVGADRLDLDAIERLRGADPAHVVPILEFETSGGLTWEIQEFFPEGSLESLLAEAGGRLTPDLAMELVTELHAAIAHVHGLDIVHRDLKPQNVLIRTREPLDCVIADFGLASQLALSQDVRSVAGTWNYLAPEGHGGVLTHAGDWWSLGVVLHEAVTGASPFVDDAGQLLPEHQIRAVVYDGTYALRPADDPRWDLLLEGLLTHDRTHRWGADEVARWLAGESPDVVRPAAGAGPGGQLPVRPFPFAGATYTSPVELAAALREHWREAGEMLAGRKVEELRAWLLRTEVGAAAEPLLSGVVSPEPAVVRLQVLLDPGTAPAFRGRALTDEGLEQVIREAATGDTEAADWIQRLRTERILTAWAAEASVPDAVSLADDRLAEWWKRADALIKALPSAGSQIASESRRAVEGILLGAALSGRQAETVLAQGSEDQGLSPLPAWTTRWAPALTPTGDGPDVGAAAVAMAVLPAAHHLEVARASAEEQAAAERRAQARAERLHTLRATRNRRMRVEWLRATGVAAVVMAGTVAMVVGLSEAGRVPQDLQLTAVASAAAAGALCALWHLLLPPPQSRLGLALVPVALTWSLNQVAVNTTPGEHQVGGIVLVPAAGVMGFYLGRLLDLAVDHWCEGRALPATTRGFRWLERTGIVVWALALIVKGAYFNEGIRASRPRPGQWPSIIDGFRSLPVDFQEGVLSYMEAMQPVHDLLGRDLAKALATAMAVLPMFLLLGRGPLSRLSRVWLVRAWWVLVVLGVCSASYHLVGLSTVVFAVGFVVGAIVLGLLIFAVALMLFFWIVGNM